MHVVAHAMAVGLLLGASTSESIFAQEVEQALSEYTGVYSGEPDFSLTIPEDTVPPPVQGTYTHMSSQFQWFATYCLDNQGSLNPDVFKGVFTSYSLEGAAGVTGLALYPEGPAFKVFARHFMEGEPSVSYRATEAPYVALILCVYPTAFPDPSLPNHPAKVRVFMTWEPEEEMLFFETADTNSAGQIFMWNFFYPDPARGFRIEVVPSQTGRTDIMLAGRLGTLLSLNAP